MTSPLISNRMAEQIYAQICETLKEPLSQQKIDEATRLFNDAVSKKWFVDPETIDTGNGFFARLSSFDLKGDALRVIKIAKTTFKAGPVRTTTVVSSPSRASTRSLSRSSNSRNTSVPTPCSFEEEYDQFLTSGPVFDFENYVPSSDDES